MKKYSIKFVIMINKFTIIIIIVTIIIINIITIIIIIMHGKNVSYGLASWICKLELEVASHIACSRLLVHLH